MKACIVLALIDEQAAQSSHNSPTQLQSEQEMFGWDEFICSTKWGHFFFYSFFVTPTTLFISPTVHYNVAFRTVISLLSSGHFIPCFLAVHTCSASLSVAFPSFLDLYLFKPITHSPASSVFFFVFFLGLENNIVWPKIPVPRQKDGKKKKKKNPDLEISAFYASRTPTFYSNSVKQDEDWKAQPSAKVKAKLTMVMVRAGFSKRQVVTTGNKV